MASVYMIVKTDHPLYPLAVEFLAGINKCFIPSVNNQGDKALLQLKDGVDIPAWSVNNIVTKDGVLWCGPREDLYTQTDVDMTEWDLPE